MKIQLPVIHTVLLLGCLTAFCSCNGQPASPSEATALKNKKKTLAKGEIVAELENRITVIYQDQRGHYWFGGGEKGICQFDGNQLVLFTRKDGLCGTNVLGIQEDQSGNIYFDTTEGVCKFDGQTFSTIPIAENSPQNQWMPEPDDLWFRMGWDNNGPYRYDGMFLYPLAFPRPSRADTFDMKFPKASYSPYGIYSMYKDRKGHLWWGTASLGACRYDGTSVSWLYEDHLTTTPEGGDFGIRSILEDRNGQFWFCNSRYRYNILSQPDSTQGSSSLHYSKEAGAGYSKENGDLHYPYFMSIEEDHEGDLWMVTYDDGVYRNDGQQLIHYPVKNGETNALLFSIYKDRQGQLWLGTHNAGVYQWKDGSFQPFNISKK
jgi:ligand-binding sensor domain-containing protein